jgi:hypothetical protein
MNTFSDIPLDVDIETKFDDEDSYQIAKVSPGLASPTRQTSPTFMMSRSQEPRRSPRSSPYSQSKPKNRALTESRKLLAHLLSQLQNRPMPPSVFESFKTSSDSSADKGFGILIETVRSAAKLKGGKLEARTQSLVLGEDHEDDEDDEEKEVVFTTNVTFDLMVQLKEVCLHTLCPGSQLT